MSVGHLSARLNQMNISHRRYRTHVEVNGIVYDGHDVDRDLMSIARQRQAQATRALDIDGVYRRFKMYHPNHRATKKDIQMVLDAYQQSDFSGVHRSEYYRRDGSSYCRLIELIGRMTEERTV